MKIFQIVAMAVLAENAIAADPDAVSTRLIADAFNFPAELVRTVPNNDQGMSRMGDVEWVVLFSNPSNLFMETSIACFKHGTLRFLQTNELGRLTALAATTRTQLTQAIDTEMKAVATQNPTYTEAQLADARRQLEENFYGMAPFLPVTRDAGEQAYIHTVLGGPGGGGILYYTHLRPQQADLLIAVTSVGEGPNYLRDSEATHDYYKKTREPLWMNQMLKSAGNMIAQRLEEKIPQPAGGAYVSPAAGDPSAHP